MSESAFAPGQRWISISEPELGLGQVRTVGARTVTLHFEATRETRQYVANDAAPIRRAAFRAGDTIVSTRSGEHTVASVRERGGLLYYTIESGELCETELSHTLSFSSPLERLFAGQFDSTSAFETRRTALRHQHERRRSEVRGLVGGRIDLLPHQLGIAAEVTSRLLPRVLLADEVGLGKTIEACLVLHRLLLTGRASRVLIVVPETLVHQWFLELLRRFNLWFHIFNEARCVAIEDANPEANPFLDDQLVLCELTLFTDNPRRVEQAEAAGWDMLVVDEAHHLEWTPTTAGAGYAAIERLARISPGLLLLTATPEQLGVASHFARLRLLDPDRFVDLESFMREAADYRGVAHLAQRLKDGAALSAEEQTSLASVLAEPVDVVNRGLADVTGRTRGEWVDRLLDQHGTGRVMFRNTRATIAGFPQRIAHLGRLDAGGRKQREALAREWMQDRGLDDSNRPMFLHEDPRIEWLLGLLQALGTQKVLVICRSQRKALAIETALRQRTSMALAAFHEGLTLVQRDRGAAWFAEPDGARVLICSEIGSEGRNFQFAHHLVLFDLPLDPALLEQRLGRLDRIGQTSDIHVHVPVIAGTHLEVLAQWYHDGLDALQQHVPGARELLERFETRILDLTGRVLTAPAAVMAELPAFVEDVRAARRETALRMEEGRDRLLEWNSSRPAQSTRVVDGIRRQDADRDLDTFMLAAFDLFFIEVEEIAPRTFKLGSAGVLVDEFPGLKADGLTVTRDRSRALLREDVQFLTWDHPLATGALDLLIGSEKGNCAFARWADGETNALYLDATYVLECVAPGEMHADRFLAPTPLTAAVDHRGSDATALLAGATLTAPPGLGAARALLARDDIRDRVVPRMVERLREAVEAQVPALITAARADMHERLTHEATRLRELQALNRTVRDEEIALLLDQQSTLDRLLANARLRLDSVRLIHRGPAR